MAKEMTKEQRKQYYSGAVEAATKFFQALKEGKDWRPFAQRHYSEWDVAARPLIVMFDDFEVMRTGLVRGANSDVCIGVYVKLQVAALSGSLPQREMTGKIAVFREEGPMRPSPEGTWGVAPNSYQPNKEGDSSDV